MNSLKLILICIWFLTSTLLSASGKEPIIIGLDADMTSGSAPAGEAIRRGALIAIAEINEKGGLLGGRKLELIVKDHQGAPARSMDNMSELAEEKNLVAVLGGLHSPAIINELKFIHDQKIIMLDPWAAATPIIDNGFNPNYCFRVSVRDQYAGGFLVAQALKQGYGKPGLLLERTGWGRSNLKAMTEALQSHGKFPAGIEWFFWGETDMTKQIQALLDAGADAVLMVANAPEGAPIVKGMATFPKDKRIPIFSHWGITGGRFTELAGEALKEVKLQVLQTYSFFKTDREKASTVVSRYHFLFKTKSVREIFAPVGTAHAYDLIHLLALAIEKAQTADRAKVRDALEQIESYSGLVRDYKPPFTSQKHEGLDPSDYRLATFAMDGAIMPVK